MMKKRELLSPDVMQVEGAALRALLDERGYGVKIAAAAAGVGTTGYLSQILNAVRPLNLEVAIRIAALLNAAIDRFSPRLANFARTAAKYVDSGPTSTGQTAPSSKRLMIARQDDASYAADWPFGITIDVARWKRLRQEHQRVVIDFVAARVAEFEAIYALDARARS